MLDTRVGVINALLTSLGIVGHPIPFLASVAWVWPALITIIAWNTLPLVALTFIASLQSLPGELVDAAEVDGASRVQVIRYIYLPHLQPAIAVMGLMSTFGPSTISSMSGSPLAPVPGSIPTSWRPRSTSRRSSTAGLATARQSA